MRTGLDLERLELPEVPVVRAERADAVLEEDGRDVGVGNEVAPNRHGAGDVLVCIDETVQL